MVSAISVTADKTKELRKPYEEDIFSPCMYDFILELNASNYYLTVMKIATLTIKNSQASFYNFIDNLRPSTYPPHPLNHVPWHHTSTVLEHFQGW